MSTGKSDGALNGVRVLEFGQVLAAPYIGLMLADQGAEVIKIEAPSGDPSRGYMPPDVEGHSPYFLSMNRNKLGVALDLKQPAAIEAVLAMVAKADVVTENFRAGVMERLGIGYEVMKAANPGIIYCAVSGYGRTGPYADRAGYDPIAQAESGLMSISGEPDGPPTRVGASVVDMVTGMFAAQAVTAALYARNEGGEGQRVDVNLFGTALNMLVNFAGQSLLTGDDPTRFGSGSQAAQPSGVFKSKDGEFMLTIAAEPMYRRFCEQVIERPELADDDRFQTNAGRVANKVALDAALGPVFATMDNDVVIERMRTAGIPCGEILGIRDALNSPMAQALELITTAPHTELGDLKTLMPSYAMSETPVRDPVGAPLIGEHTRAVLRDVAGFDDARIDAMVAEGAAIST
ncbi:MAG: CoA transferase [Rhodospirillaceae bacterium]|nr:CoA transferase [Rhodospirillaceae bacterium]